MSYKRQNLKHKSEANQKFSEIEMSLTQNLTARDETSLLVVFSSKESLKTGEKTKKADHGEQKSQAKIHNSAVQAHFKSAIEQGRVKGEFLECLAFPDVMVDGFCHVAVLGLGSDWDAESMRQVSAHILSLASSLKVKNISLDLRTVLGTKAQAHPRMEGLAQGLLLSNYDFNELKSKNSASQATKSNERKLQVDFVAKEAADAAVKKLFQSAQAVVSCVNFSRWLGDMPGNLMTPSILADEVTDFAKGTGIKCTIWDKARIKKERMGGLLGVANGSDEDPRFIILEYKGAGPKEQPLVFVGKGLTFDTGGISIKPSAAMEEMKYDMCGGANVLGSVLAMAKLKLKVNVVALVPATENMPGGSATKPGDIHTARNGKTFEVNNTDAEGRLILSDALCYGSELKPKMMVDAATLTGAMVVALGNIHTGFYTRNDELNKKIQKAAETSGECVWRMPLVDHHGKDMKGTFADLSNISSSKGAGSATAAAFLEQFVEAGIPWAHFDIAGTAWAVGNRLPYSSKKGASGCMVRTFVELARQFE